MSERPPDPPEGEEPPLSDVPDEDEAVEGYVPHHREEFVGWIKTHPPGRREGEETDEPAPTDEPKPTADENP